MKPDMFRPLSEQGRKRLGSLVHTPPRQGSAVQQAVSKTSTSFWSALHDFARHDRPVPAKGWEKVGPDHPFLSVRSQVLLRRCLAVEFHGLLHCPDSSQHHTPPSHLVKRSKVKQPQVPLLKQSVPQPALHLNFVAAPECGQPERSHTPR
jgi:hypothetical protein